MSDTKYQILPISSRDLERAVPDILALRCGVGPVRNGNPHPLADQYRETNLANIAASFGGLLDPSNPAEVTRALRSGISSVQFSAGLELFGRHIIGRQFAQDDTVRRLCRPLPVPDFKPQNRATIQVTGLKEAPEGAELPVITGRVFERQDRPLKTWAAALLIGRESILNDDMELVGQLFGETGEMLARNESREVFSFLDSNPTTAELDGRGGSARAWFTVEDGNLITGQSMNLAGITAAAAALRKQTGPDGHPANIKPAFLLVPVESEMAARAIVHDSGLPLEVMTSPFINAGRFYLAARHEERPAIGLQFLGSPGDGIRTWTVSAARKLPPTFEGVGHHVVQDLRPVALSRRGLVRVELTT